MIDTVKHINHPVSYSLKNLINCGPGQVQSQVQNWNLFHAKASNKAHVFGEQGKGGLLHRKKKHHTDKIDTHSLEGSLIGCS